MSYDIHNTVLQVGERSHVIDTFRHLVPISVGVKNVINKWPAFLVKLGH